VNRIRPYAPFILQLSILLSAIGACGAVLAAEPIGVLMKDGNLVMAEVVSIGKDGAQLRTDGKVKSFTLDLIDPRGVRDCAKAAPDLFNASWQIDMGSYFLDKKYYKDAQEYLESAVRMNPTLETELAPKLKQAQQSLGVKDDKSPGKSDIAKSDPKKVETKNATKKPDSSDDDVSPGDTPTFTNKNAEDFAAKFRRRDVKARTPDEMKAFIDKRTKELEDQIGGTWRMIETKHFYCFANIKEDLHKKIAVEWNEQTFYDRVSRMLQHKEGDKLWNNKCPIYYFEKFSQFQKFAAVIDHDPNAGNSGGYFAAQGREVHVCIPFDIQQAGSLQAAEHHARDTVVHEGTHAFLQLTGEDVPINRWLHEGLAQFMEFWVEKEGSENGQYGKDRRERATHLARLVQKGDVPSWSDMRQRPGGGTDLVGYSFAWSKVEFLYRCFSNQCLPTMIHLLKAGKTEDEALAQAFGRPPEQLEAQYKQWVKELAKTGFKFE